MFALVGVALLFATSVQAASHTTVVAQRSTKKTGTVFLAARLTTGHRYRIDVTSSGHRVFTGYGIENYVFVKNGQIGEGSKPLTLKGKTPWSLTLNQPISGHLGSWLLSTTVQVLGSRALTVRIVDTTHSKK
jgi:ribosomal protein L31